MTGAGGNDGRDGQRLTRPGGNRRPLGKRVSERLALIAYATPLADRKLKGRQPLKILATPTDPILGSAERGREIAAGRLAHAGHVEVVRTLNFARLDAPLAWREWLHGFGWLRDLAAATDRKKGAMVAEVVVEAWLARHRDYDELAWRPDLAGQRLLNWILHAPYILSRSEPIYRSLVLNHLARCARHLDRAHDKTEEGMARVAAAAGLLAAGLMLPEGAARTVRAEAALAKALAAFVLPGGGVASRRPSDVLDVAELLITLRALYLARRSEVAPAVGETLDMVMAGLKGLQLGDGALAALNGGNVCDARRVRHVLSLAGSAARPTRNGAASGFQRLSAGNAVVVADAGPPPVAAVARGAHAGSLAFEMSDGDTRMIVNCGGGHGALAELPRQLGELLRTTAAHSTLVVADTNSTRLISGEGLGRGVEEVVMTRHESDEGDWLEATHDGYARKYGLIHRRRLFLAGDGRDLRGEDRLEPVGARRLGRRKPVAFDIRFHLGPGIEATPTADAHGALVKLPGGTVWQVKARGGRLTVDDSLFVDASGTPRPIRQIVVSGETDAGGAVVKWSFKRASR